MPHAATELAFLLEVRRQCWFALVAFGEMKASIDRNDPDRLWYSIQAFLVAAGIASRLLWPGRPDSKKRAGRRWLRQMLGVSEESPLADRSFRNHYEHFDERIEQWANETGGRAFIDSHYAAVGAEAAGSGISLRSFDPKAWTLVFRGRQVHLLPIVEVLESLRASASEEWFRRRKG